MKGILSQSQLGVYYACRTAVDEQVNYQNPALFALPENVDVTRLQNAVSEALNAHAYLLSRVVLDENGEPYVEVQGDKGQSIKGAKVEVLQVTEEEWAEAQKTFARTMDIYGERLYRAEIYKVQRDKVQSTKYLYLDFHHVLADGFTIALMLKEIERAYSCLSMRMCIR